MQGGILYRLSFYISTIICFLLLQCGALDLPFGTIYVTIASQDFFDGVLDVVCNLDHHIDNVHITLHDKTCANEITNYDAVSMNKKVTVTNEIGYGLWIDKHMIISSDLTKFYDKPESHKAIGQIEFCTKIQTSFDDILSATNFKLKFGFADDQFIFEDVAVVKEEIYTVM